MDTAAKQILTNLKSRKYAPVYLLQGEEAFYIDLISNYIEENVLSESERSFNQVVLYGNESPVSTILNHARRFPMMSEYQVVMVKEAQGIPDLGKESGQKLLLDYFSRPVPSTILVLCHKYKALDKRKELGKQAEKLVTSVTFKKPYDNQLPDFVVEYLGGIELEMEEMGVRAICESVGNDLGRIANELEKLKVGRKPGSKITAAEVMSQVGMNREYNIFELQKALVDADQFKTAQISEYFASNTKRNPGIMVVAFLFSFYSKLLLAAAASPNSERELVNALKISPYGAKDYWKALQHYSLAKVCENVALLREADLRLKGVNSGSTEEGEILRELTLRLVR